MAAVAPRSVPPASHCAAWTERADQTLIRLWQSGLAVREIAMRIGRTRGACYDRAKILGLPGKRPVEKVIMQLVVWERGRRTIMVRVRLRPARVRDGQIVRRHVSRGQKLRHCLRCGNDFLSTWAGHRMCDACHAEIREMA